MKHLLILSAFLILHSGCSSKNAFSEFNMTKAEEMSVSSFQSSKVVTKSNDISGIVSAVYLNEIYPKIYNDKEYFFLYTYIKNSETSSADKPNIKLNNHSYTDLRELPKESRFSNLVSTTSRWNKYYIATFEKENNSTLELILVDGKSSSSSLIYNKTED